MVYKNNPLTAQHVLVPGTHVAIVPPSGATLSSSFTGFLNEPRRVTCEIREVLTPFANIEPSLTPEKLEGEGIAVQDTTDVNLNGKPAKLIAGTYSGADSASTGVGEAGEGIGVVMFVFGNDRLTVFVKGYYPLSDKSAAAQLRNSMLSAILEPKQKENPAEPYTISAAGTEFKLADEAGGTKRFTIGGKPYGSTISDAIFISSFFTQAITRDEQAGFADKSAEQFLSKYEHTILSKRNIQYGGIPGIEIIADVKGNERRDRTASGGTVMRPIPARGYVAVLFDPNSDLVYSFTGIALQNAEGYLSQFIRITSTFSRPQPK
ncbi:MAG: hypothetical protein LBS45_09460 [Synergistaceae bacterium]|nr:hypothetical protein [Synergistaceae bacterium]